MLYYSFVKNYYDASYLAPRAIVCPTNEVVDSTNGVVFSMVPGDGTGFDTSDTICKTMANTDLPYSLEFLHTVILL